MTAKIILFIFPILLVALPVLFYRNSRPYMMGVWLRLAYNENGRKMAGNLTALLVAIFHIVYFAAYPKDYGIMFSTLIVFTLLSTKRCVSILQGIRWNKTIFLVGAALCIITCAIPHMFSLAMSVAMLLEASCFFPSKGLENFYEEHVTEPEVDKMFVDAYFS